WNYPDYVAFRDRNESFSGLATYSGSSSLGMQLEGADAASTTELTEAASVSGNYFDVLGVAPAIGRLFDAEDDRASGDSPYVVLSYEYWHSRFNNDPNAIGRTIRLNGYPFTIVGVSRRGCRGRDVASSPNIFIPILMHSQITGVPFMIWNTRHYWWIQVIGRLAPGASVVQAETELFAVYRDQEASERQDSPAGGRVNEARPMQLIPAARGYSYVRNQLQRP